LHIHAYAHTSPYTHVPACVHSCICTHISLHTCTCMCSFMHTHTHTHLHACTQVSEFVISQRTVKGRRLRQTRTYTKEDIEQSATTRRLWDLARNKAAFMIQKFIIRTLARSAAKRCVCINARMYVLHVCMYAPVQGYEIGADTKLLFNQKFMLRKLSRSAS
jgi:hypothetical protein